MKKDADFSMPFSLPSTQDGESEKRYKAGLKFVPEDEASLLKGRSCIVLISMNNPNCHFEKLRATLRLVNKRFRDCIIVVADTLYRHNLASIYPKKTDQNSWKCLCI